MGKTMKERIRASDFHMIHFESSCNEMTVSFCVYEVADAEYLSGPKKGIKTTSYLLGGFDETVDEDEFDESMTKGLMNGSYCWRGAWEGRIYFGQEEYLSEDLKILSGIFSDIIEPWCKNHIRKFHQHAEE